MSYQKSSKQVIQFLKEDKDNYVEKYIGVGYLYNSDLEQVGECSFTVLKNLIVKGIIKKVGEGTGLHSGGYFKLPITIPNK